VGRLLTGRDASGTYGIQMFSIRREQGRLAELAPAVRILAAGTEREGPWRPGLVAVLVELGMEDEARRELSRLAAEGIDGFRTSLWTATLAYCLYEAPSPDAILAAARKADVPADVVVEVSAATPQFSGRLRDWADSVG
jgi:hypothetical protein